MQLVTRLLERGCRCGEGRCSRLLKVKKVGEGRYNIAGRNVFIRVRLSSTFTQVSRLIRSIYGLLFPYPGAVVVVQDINSIVDSFFCTTYF